VGDEVVDGDPIGLVGNSGRSTGPHLHFEVSRDEILIDPLEVLGTTVSLE
jgi:murein DD-endopeptidase MepM/ murein hydrolase activator NlpD